MMAISTSRSRGLTRASGIFFALRPSWPGGLERMIATTPDRAKVCQVLDFSAFMLKN
jgi:hypothetical protein